MIYHSNKATFNTFACLMETDTSFFLSHFCFPILVCFPKQSAFSEEASGRKILSAASF